MAAGHVARFNPRLAVVELPYTPWSRLCASPARPNRSEDQQEDDRIYLHLVQRIFEEQKRRGGHAMAESSSRPGPGHGAGIG